MSNLKKEFSSRDVQRMRNIITKKGGDATGVQIGYKKDTEIHEEGSNWVKNGKTWTIKNGLKMTVSKLDAVKKALFLPLACPKCKKVMKNPLDKKMYPLHKQCFECVIKFEDGLKMDGKFNEYEKKIFNSNLDSHIRDIELEAMDFIMNGRESTITESGEIESWNDVDNSQEIKDGIKKYIEMLKELYI